MTKKRLTTLIMALLATLCATLLFACGSEDSGKVTVEFSTGTEESIPARVMQTGSAYGELPVPSARKYFEFIGWTTDSGENGAVVGKDQAVEDNGGKSTLYAKWKYIGKERTAATIGGQSGYHLAIDGEGTLWSWGSNSGGQLGDGTRIGKYSPVKVKLDKKIKSVSTNGAFAIDEDGKLWGWGTNSAGQLGSGDVSGAVCTPVAILPGETFVRIEFSDNTYALTEGGNIGRWGPSNLTPRLIADGIEYVDISAEMCGYHQEYLLALDKSGFIWSCGSNDYGQLGNGEISKTDISKLSKIGNNKFVRIAAGRMGSSYAIDDKGNVWGWGNGGNIGLMGPDYTGDPSKPTKLKGLPKMVEISTYGNTIMAIDVNDDLWAWGVKSEYPTPVKLYEDKKFSEVVCGSCSIAKDIEGNIYTWGDNKNGGIGDGEFGKQLTPQKLNIDGTFAQVSAGQFYNLALDESGNIWSWGRNYEGSLGNGTKSEPSSVPIQITSGVKYKSVFAGERASYAIDENDDLWAWGKSAYGVTGTDEEKYRPQKANIDTKVKSVSFDTNGNVLLVGTDGKLYGNVNIKVQPEFDVKDAAMCGSAPYLIDNDNRLWTEKNGEYINLLPEVSISRISNSGSLNVLVVDTDGGLWGLGDNKGNCSTGQTGEVDKRYGSIPLIRIDESIKYSYAAAASDCSFAIDEQGTLIGWGSSEAPCIQHNMEYSVRMAAFPVMKPKYNVLRFECEGGYIEVSLGSRHGVALDKGGNIWTWGDNTHGQLGHGEIDLNKLVHIILQ